MTPSNTTQGAKRIDAGEPSPSRFFRKAGGFPSYSTTLFVEVPLDSSQCTKLHRKDSGIFPTEYYPLGECLGLVDRGVWEEIATLEKQAAEFSREWRDIDHPTAPASPSPVTEETKGEGELLAAREEIRRLTDVDFNNAALIDKLQADRDHYRHRFEWWMNEAKGIARDRAELMSAGERYPIVVNELRTLLKQRIDGSGPSPMPAFGEAEAHMAKEDFGSPSPSAPAQAERIFEVASSIEGECPGVTAPSAAQQDKGWAERAAKVEPDFEFEGQFSQQAEINAYAKGFDDAKGKFIKLAPPSATPSSLSAQGGAADTRRLDWLELDYNARKVRVTKKGITVAGVDEWQPSLRVAIDVARARDRATPEASK